MRNNSERVLWSGLSEQDRTHKVLIRLDEALPLETPEWQVLERMLIRLSEFAPTELLIELTSAIVTFADDQARQAYILGQEDVAADSKRMAA